MKRHHPTFTSSTLYTFTPPCLHSTDSDNLSLSLDRALELLTRGEMQPQGLLPYGSNYTFLVSITLDDLQTAAIYKPRQGERPLWDFPDGTLCQREVAAFVVSQALDWFIVPPTVLRDGTHGLGMVQFYIDCNPEEHYFTLQEETRFHDQFKQIALFDLLINNADRKSGHCLRDESDHIWAIDHGVCFSVEPKLRTVIWEFAGQPIPDRLVDNLQGISSALRSTRRSVRPRAVPTPRQARTGRAQTPHGSADPIGLFSQAPAGLSADSVAACIKSPGPV